MEGTNFSKTRSLRAMLFIVAVAQLLSGCIFTEYEPLQISLAPRVPTVPINIGAGTKVYLSVLDQRPEKTLGYRQIVARWQGMARSPMYEESGIVLVSGDVEALIRNSLKDGLANLGFEILNAPEPSVPKLEVTVQNMAYQPFHPSSGLGASFNAGFTGKLYKGDALLYEHLYHYPHGQQTTACRPANRSCFEENFNAALSDLMSQILADLELLKALR
jgi:YajG family uncharacterized lipoprotein